MHCPCMRICLRNSHKAKQRIASRSAFSYKLSPFSCVFTSPSTQIYFVFFTNHFSHFIVHYYVPVNITVKIRMNGFFWEMAAVFILRV